MLSSLGCVGSQRSIDGTRSLIDGKRSELAAALPLGTCQRTRGQQDAALKVGQFCWRTRARPQRVERVVANHVDGRKALSPTQQPGG